MITTKKEKESACTEGGEGQEQGQVRDKGG